MAGHRVVEAATSEEALRLLEGLGAGVVLASEDLPPGGCGGLQEAMRRHARLAEIPVVALAASARDRESMLASIQQLSAAVTAAVIEPATLVPAVSLENQA